MTTWFYGQINTAALVSNEAVLLINGLSAGAVLCAIDAKVQFTIVNPTYGVASQRVGETFACGINFVDHGNAANSVTGGKAVDNWIDLKPADAVPDPVVWAPSTATAAESPIFPWSLKWRGVRRFVTSKDFYWVWGYEFNAGTALGRGWVRMGFWS